MKLNKRTTDAIYKLVYEYPVKHKEGFIAPETNLLINIFHQYMDMKKYDNAMMGNTCMMDAKDGLIIYHCDVYQALICGLEGRELTLEEWD